VNGHPLAYLDSAATALVPHSVIEALVRAYTHDAGSVHRGAHALSERATLVYEGARGELAALFGVGANELVLTAGTTDALSGVARSLIEPGDVVIVSALEHHANLLPWQRAQIRECRLDELGNLDLDHLEQLLPGAKLVAITQLSNVLGTTPPIDAIVERAHAAGALVVVDGAQAAAHLPDGPRGDFWVCSGHKLYGPGGTGVLWSRRLDRLRPWRLGGGIVAHVSIDRADLVESPQRFEAGTPNAAGVIGLGAAARYARELGPARFEHERALHAELVRELRAIRGVRVLGEPTHALASFTVDGIHPHDLATLVDRKGVAIRAGHHCAQPLHAHFGIAASARASLGLYSNRADIAQLVAAIDYAREVLV
jgi:cysteine desulfurase/selenocysteine lyase